MASPNVHESSLSDSDGDESNESVDLLAPPRETPKRKQVSATENGIDDSHPAKKKRTKHDEEVGNTNIREKTSDIVAASTSTIPDPIVPKLLVDSNATWFMRDNCVLVRRPQGQCQVESSRKVAGFDLDQTLFLWKCAGWPSRPEHYELWSSAVISKFQMLHQNNYQIIIFTNQGGIRSAVEGKVASRIKGLIDWLAITANVPLWAFASIATKSGHHKPSPKMWQILETECGIEFDLSNSFYVGDSDGSSSSSSMNGSANHHHSSSEYQQQAVDKLFAENVGALRNTNLSFHTPQDFFGESDRSKRNALQQMETYKSPPPTVFQVRAALLGGYLKSPILLLLCGVQGSGKSTFCQLLLQNKNTNWIHLSQDTIRNGKPGKREAVEAAAYKYLEEGKPVIIDRMHLTPEQRSHFISVANGLNVPVHAVFFNPPSKIIFDRVKNRTNHAGGVQGARGVSLTKISLKKMITPEYEEGFAFIITCTSAEVVNTVCASYQHVGVPDTESSSSSSLHTTTSSLSLPLNLVKQQNSDTDYSPIKFLPSVIFGTQKIGKRIASDIVTLATESGIQAVDTASTYNNEEQIGAALQKNDKIFVIYKIPKRATSPDQVKSELEQSMKKLGRVDMILLHWPCDVLENDSLQAVWKTMEAFVEQKKCRYLGVSNFSIDALRTLLPFCTSAHPVVNQVERHALLPQWELLDFCSSQGILLQAHTSLGQGKAELLQHPKVLQIARDHPNATPAQVLWKWNLQHGVHVVSKCTSDEHIKEFASLDSVTTLTPTQMKELDSIGMDSSHQVRFVAPPFMYKAGAAYSWGDRAPITKQTSTVAK
eukprot:scaffold61263_cov44-Attheya_sp.AAC.3